MTTRFAVVLTVIAVCVGSLALAQQAESPDLPLVNWTAPPYWTPPAAEQARQQLTATGTADNHGVTTEATSTTTILPFTAVPPCRLYDNRASDSPFTGDSTFNTDGQTEQFDFFSTATPPYAPTVNPNGCTLPTAGTVGAWSLKFTYRTSSASQGYLTAYPGSLTTRPGIGTILGSSTQQTSGAAIVPAGTDADNTIKVYAQYAANTIVIDYNGYFAAQPVVTSLTGGTSTLTGDVTLAAGSNIAITPSGKTFTIAMTGVSGGTLPAGTLAGQTLYWNGSGWLASSVLTNDGSSNVGINGNLNLPSTTSSASGVINFGGSSFIHNFTGAGTDGHNTFVGQNTGNFTMGGSSSYYGSYNTAVGDFSLVSNTTGNDNTAAGVGSLASNTTGYNNTANGVSSLAHNTTGGYNTASGYQSLFANTTASDNTAFGYESLNSNTTANKNTAVGSGALYTQSYDPGTGPYDAQNTAVGYQALYSNQTDSATATDDADGALNTAVGATALQSNTTATRNTAIGHESMRNNTTGSRNTAIGMNSLLFNTTANRNTALGEAALPYQSYDNGGTPWDTDNTAVGCWAMENNNPDSATDGYRNTAVGSYGLYLNTTGSNNIAVGYNAGYNLTTGNWNIDIGNGGGAGEGNTIRLGVQGTQTATFIAGISGVTVSGAGVLVNSSGQLGVASSSLRFKQDVADMGGTSSRLMELRPVTFHYKTQPDGPLQYGLIAEEVEQVMPELVVKDATGQLETVANHELPAMLLNELQKQRAQIEAKDARIAALENEQTTQQAQIEELRAALAERDGALERRLTALEQGRR